MTDRPDPSEAAVVSIMRQVDGDAVVTRGRLVARQPSSLTVQLDDEHPLPGGMALAVVVHDAVPHVALGSLTSGTGSLVTIRLAERRG